MRIYIYILVQAHRSTTHKPQKATEIDGKEFLVDWIPNVAAEPSVRQSDDLDLDVGYKI